MGFQNNGFLGEEEAASVFYHDIFDYPLSTKEIIKWRVGKRGLALFKKTKKILNKDGFYFLENKENLLYKKALRERISKRKIEIAKRNAYLLIKIPTILGVFITGALAMNNAKEESDIDILIITKRNLLWITRLFVYLVLRILNSGVRKYGDVNQKDKLCLNVWLDESALVWDKKDRNIYSAHEIAQVNPIEEKCNIYQRFLQKNVWILDYWPNSVRIDNVKYKIKNNNNKESLIEKLSYYFEYKYMRKKITREKVGKHRAIFHPRNWGDEVLKKLSS